MFINMSRAEFFKAFGLADDSRAVKLTEEVIGQLTQADLAALKKYLEYLRYEVDPTDFLVNEVLLVLTRPFGKGS